jgi:S1-C subfamily serine protease
MTEEVSMHLTTHSLWKLLLLSILLWQPLHAVAQERITTTAPFTPTMPTSLPSVLTVEAGRARVLEQRVASALQQLGKTLILERTRGAKDVNIYRKAAPAVVLVVADTGLGSGTIIDSQGHVLTNWHVVANAPHVVVVLKPHDSTALKKELAFRALVEKVDAVTDLALLRIDTPPPMLPTLPLGAMASLAVGQDVHAIGHPQGEVWTYTLMSGHIF